MQIDLIMILRAIAADDLNTLLQSFIQKCQVPRDKLRSQHMNERAHNCDIYYLCQS